MALLLNAYVQSVVVSSCASLKFCNCRDARRSPTFLWAGAIRTRSRSERSGLLVRRPRSAAQTTRLFREAPGSALRTAGRRDPPSGPRTTHPPESPRTRPIHLAEGATGTFLDTSVALLNPGTAPASVLLRFLKDDGATVTQQVPVPAGARRTMRPAALTGLASANFSTAIESNALVVVDRTMTWGDGYGSHAETALTSPSTTWYLAEGSTSGEFNLFSLLQNPNGIAVQATVRYLLPSGHAAGLRDLHAASEQSHDDLCRC